MLELNPKITNAGLALPLGTALTHIAFGTGAFDPTGAETTLRAEAFRVPVTTGRSSVPTKLQIGALIGDLDSQGRTLNGKTVGEIGLFAGNVLWAVWSRASGNLFVKSANINHAWAYKLDVSALPPNAVTINVNADQVGMASMLLDHQSDPDPHPAYAFKTAVQSNAFCYGMDIGTLNQYKVNFTPALTALIDGMIVTFQAAAANTGAATFSPNVLATKPIVGGAHAPLQSGEIVAGGKVELIYHATLGAWALLACSGGALQVPNAQQGAHATNLAQVNAAIAAAVSAAINALPTAASQFFMNQS